MRDILNPIHSLLRWVVLLLLLAVIIKSLQGLIKKRAFSNSDNKISLYLMISAHTQLVVGLLLYYVSPYVQFNKQAMTDNEVRFFTMEHSVMMLIAIVFITIARISSKKATTDVAKFRRLFTYCFVALLIILMAIPWPFSQISRPWF